MKQFVIFIIFYFMLFYYEKQVSGSVFDNQIDDNVDDLEGLTGGRGKLLKGQLNDPDTDRNVSELITSKGFPVEEHTVQTDDGYLLTLLRIPHGRNGSREKEDKKVVLLIHGDLSDAVQWVLDFPNQSLGFILPDKGYDTWLLNNRGCKYSKKHIEFKIHEYRFWNFRFEQLFKDPPKHCPRLTYVLLPKDWKQELGQHDVPATIDYILEETNKDGLYIVGHSRGTSQTFAMLSEMPDYNAKVKLFIAMAPATFFGHMTSPVRALLPIADQAARTINLATGGEFLPDNQISKKIKEEFCAVVAPDLCENLIFAIGGADKAQLNETRFDVYAAHFPSTTSMKCLLHYAQLVRTKKYRKFDYEISGNLKYYHQTRFDVYAAHFPSTTSMKCLLHYAQLVRTKKYRKFDYEISGNLKYYHQEEPPDYNLSSITTPVALFWSSNDKIVDPRDVDLLRSELNTVVFDYPDLYPYNHFDFAIAKNAPKLLYKPVLKLLAEK